MKKLKIAVTGTGGNIGYGIMRALRMSSLEITVVAFDADPLAAGLYRADESYLLPWIDNEKECFEAVKEICQQAKIDALLVGSDGELLFYLKYKEDIERATGTKILMNRPEGLKNDWSALNKAEINSSGMLSFLISKR